MNTIKRSQDSFWTGFEFDHFFWAGADTKATTEAAIFNQGGLFSGWFFWIICRGEGDCFHGTDVNALAAACAVLLLNFRNKIGRMDRIQNGKAPGGNHRFAAAATAIADKIDFLPDIFPELDQIVIVGLLQQI